MASNNHASPSGALPFLIAPDGDGTPVPARRIAGWAGVAPSDDPEIVAFQALVDTQIREAWVVTRPLSSPLSSSPLPLPLLLLAQRG